MRKLEILLVKYVQSHLKKFFLHFWKPLLVVYGEKLLWVCSCVRNDIGSKYKYLFLGHWLRYNFANELIRNWIKMRKQNAEKKKRKKTFWFPFTHFSRNEEWRKKKNGKWDAENENSCSFRLWNGRLLYVVYHCNWICIIPWVRFVNWLKLFEYFITILSHFHFLLFSRISRVFLFRLEYVQWALCHCVLTWKLLKMKALPANNVSVAYSLWMVCCLFVYFFPWLFFSKRCTRKLCSHSCILHAHSAHAIRFASVNAWKVNWNKNENGFSFFLSFFFNNVYSWIFRTEVIELCLSLLTNKFKAWICQLYEEYKPMNEILIF